MRRQLVTVRWPGASNAPIKSTCACRQTRSENNGAKVFKRETNSGGKDSKEDHFLGHLYTTVPSRNGQSRAKPTTSGHQLSVLGREPNSRGRRVPNDELS